MRLREKILNGDFNCEYLPKKPSPETKKLKSFGLTRLINEPTRTTSSTATLFDQFANPNPRDISRAVVAESCLSDYDMLISVRKINNCKELTRGIKCRNYAKYDPTNFCSDLKKVPWDTVLSSTSVDEPGLCGSATSRLCDKHSPLIDKKILDFDEIRNYQNQLKRFVKRRLLSSDREEELEQEEGEEENFLDPIRKNNPPTFASLNEVKSAVTSFKKEIFCMRGTRESYVV
ncbi:hypothetical protein ACROYT_G028416 [Oculina patagonica]